MTTSKKVTVWTCELCDRDFLDEILARNCCQPKTMAEKKTHCAGCYNDFYNEGGLTCWSLEDAHLMLLKEVHINDRPPWMHTPRLIMSCYKKPKYVYVRANQTH